MDGHTTYLLLARREVFLGLAKRTTNQPASAFLGEPRSGELIAGPPVDGDTSVVGMFRSK